MKCWKLSVIGITLVVLFYSCGQKKSHQEETQNISCFNLYESATAIPGFTTIYSKEGDIIAYTKDSVGNYEIYYAKLDFVPGNYQHIKDKISRSDFSSSNNLIGVYTFNCCFVIRKNEGSNTLSIWNHDMNRHDYDSINIDEQVITKGTDTSNSEEMLILNNLQNASRIAKELSQYSKELDQLCDYIGKSSNIEIDRPTRQDSVYNDKYHKIIEIMKRGINGLNEFHDRFNVEFNRAD